MSVNTEKKYDIINDALRIEFVENPQTHFSIPIGLVIIFYSIILTEEEITYFFFVQNLSNVYNINHEKYSLFITFKRITHRVRKKVYRHNRLKRRVEGNTDKLLQRIFKAKQRFCL